MRHFQVEKLEVIVSPNRETLGVEAGKAIETVILKLLKSQETVRMIFASAPSQKETLAFLKKCLQIPWSRVVAFHMDEYHTLEVGHKASFSTFLYEQVFNETGPRSFHPMHFSLDTLEEEMAAYLDLIKEAPIDICLMGIGENAHLAFNDPGVADFHDPLGIKVVQLDEACRIQQVNDKAFSSLEQVPQEAITLTIPTLLSATYKFIMVPGKTKTHAVYQTLHHPISESVPSTILRTCDRAWLFVDEDSYEGGIT